jgi:hypothetical protein
MTFELNFLYPINQQSHWKLIRETNHTCVPYETNCFRTCHWQIDSNIRNRKADICLGQGFLKTISSNYRWGQIVITLCPSVIERIKRRKCKDVETGLTNKKIMQPVPCLHRWISVRPSVRHPPSTSDVSEMKTIVSNIRSWNFCVVHNLTCPS